ncbi:MAG: hypothetical protein AB1750_11975 [Chloroflexota bacterium]
MTPLKSSFFKQATAILILAGTVILWDFFSAHGGMKSGMVSVIVVALTLLLLGAMYIGRPAHSEEEPTESSAEPDKSNGRHK